MSVIIFCLRDNNNNNKKDIVKMGLKFYEDNIPRNIKKMQNNNADLLQKIIFSFAFFISFWTLHVLRNIIYQSKSSAVTLRYGVFCVREKNNNFKNILVMPFQQYRGIINSMRFLFTAESIMIMPD